MTATDAQLLADFANRRDEGAFRELARRHLGLVFHTALRSTGNRALSEEIAQNVLCAVAAKAGSLARHPERFAAWLHRAAVFESSKAMRKEASHQRRSRLQHPDAVATTIDEEDSRWQAVLPLLDTALDSLPESDRRVVVLHFFERRQFVQIGALLGKTPAAVQKQSVRALEKLARVLRGKGAAIPIGLLATGISIESAKSAPAGLLASATSAGLAAKVGSSFTSLAWMVQMPQKGFAACALLLVALPACWQQIAIARTERDLAGLRAAGLQTSGTVMAVSAPEMRFSQISGSLQIDQLIREFRLARRSPALNFVLRSKLESAQTELLGDLLTALKDEPLDQEDRSGMAQMMADALAKKDLPLAMEKLQDGWVPTGEIRGAGHWLLELYRRLASQDPAAAREWLAKVEAQPGFAAEGRAVTALADRAGEARSRTFSSRSLEDFRGALLTAFIAGDPDGALHFLESYPPDTWQAAIVWKAAGRARALPDSPAVAGNWLKITRTLNEADRAVATKVLGQFREGAGDEQIDLSRASALLRAEGATKDERETLAGIAVGSYLRDKRSEVVRDRDEEIREWLSPLMPGGSAERIATSVREDVDRVWAEQAAEELDQLVRMRQDAPASQAWLVQSLSTMVFKGELLDQALGLAAKIKNPEQRARAIRQLRNNANR